MWLVTLLVRRRVKISNILISGYLPELKNYSTGPTLLIYKYIGTHILRSTKNILNSKSTYLTVQAKAQARRSGMIGNFKFRNRKLRNLNLIISLLKQTIRLLSKPINAINIYYFAFN